MNFVCILWISVFQFFGFLAALARAWKPMANLKCISHCVMISKTNGLLSMIKRIGDPLKTNFPSRLYYLPSTTTTTTITSPNPEPKNRARTSDIEAVLENDLQVIPLAVDQHDQRNGFQYQPIISRQYSQDFTESPPRYFQSVVQNLLLQFQSENTPQVGVVKPITTRSENSIKRNNIDNENENQRQSLSFQDDRTTLRNLSNRKLLILTANDQGNNNTDGKVVKEERLPLQLTPPLRYDISRISKLMIRPNSQQLDGPDQWSKEKILIAKPSSAFAVVTPAGYNDPSVVFKDNEYRINYDNNNYHNQNAYKKDNYYQLDIRNSIIPAGDNNFQHLIRSNRVNDVSTNTAYSSDHILGAILLQAYKSYDNHGYNTHQHLPTNPILALLLSHYGKYRRHGIKDRKIYSYMAVNNIHNNKPFGSYKLNFDDDASSLEHH